MMAGSRTFTVLRFVFLMLLMRCDGNALDLPVHLSGKEATVTKFRCDARTDGCVIVNVTECPVTVHVCDDGAVQINNATRDGCLIASRAGINEKGLLFIEVFVDNLSLTKKAVCTHLAGHNKTDTYMYTTRANVSDVNATKMTFCAGDAVCTGHHDVTYDRGVCHGSIRDIAFRLAVDKQIALTPEISKSTSSFHVFHSSSLDMYSFYKSHFTSGHQGAMVEVYILGTRDYQVHIDTETDVCVFPAPTPSIAESSKIEQQYIASITMITVPICLLAVICVIVIMACFFRKRRPSRRLDVPDDSHEAISLQTVTTSNGSEESSRNNSNDGLIEEESTRV